MTSSKKRTASETSSPSRSQFSSPFSTSLREVDGPQVAGLVGQQGLLAAGIGGLDCAGKGVRGIDPVDEDHARIASPPGGVGDEVHQLLQH